MTTYHTPSATISDAASDQTCPPEYGGATGSPDYAYKTIEEYEKIVGYKVSEAFRIGWDMARTTNAHLGILANDGVSRVEPDAARRPA